ncbi:hypothetical protein RSOLAG22IIIB_05379 [Rhizoctonia solani]|uniref:NAD(P)-binding domain-containing protein n=1 Tax=Rhizoctonia solani TaxID=456999 RepID=A0A0K6G5Z9_9AGAM|nr:hypothetical protein RSOLAG22IIIB_05379 [Rhizoctonia solani]
MRVLLLGASQNIGYFVAQRLLAKGHTCTFLLRRPDAMQSDPSMSEYIQSGSAKLVRGDALVREDVQKVWDVANSDGPVDLIFFGIGGYPSFSLTKGFVLNPADLTTRSMSILLSVVQASSVRPKLITVSSNGLDPRTHSLLPWLLKIFYEWGLRQPHEDKIGLENNVKQATSSEGWLDPKNSVIVRPSLLTSGKCLADTKSDAYRTGEELRSAWTVSRADVGHFIAEKVVEEWDRWAGKAWVVSY